MIKQDFNSMLELLKKRGKSLDIQSISDVIALAHDARAEVTFKYNCCDDKISISGIFFYTIDCEVIEED